MARTTPTRLDSLEAPRGRGLLVMCFGVAMVVAMLSFAILRLFPHAARLVELELSSGTILALVVWVMFMAYAEGYRGFHLKFSPRVVARAYHLGRIGRFRDVILALPFCLALYHTTKRQRIVSTLFILFLSTLIVMVRFLPPLWRGVIDAGVVVGLSLGILSIAYYFVLALRGRVSDQPELPESG